MVILQFNKLIRNKWVWGAFAILVSAAFMAPDDWFRSDDRDRDPATSHNKLKGVELDAALFDSCRYLVGEFAPKMQGVVRSPLSGAFQKNDTKSVWKAYAAAVAAKEAGITIPDSVLADRIKALFQDGEGGFSETKYRNQVTSYFRIDPSLFEDQLRLWMTLEAAVGGFVESSAWLASMELDQTSRDFTDKFTVRIATFDEDKAKSESIKADDEMLAKWYEGHKDELSLPDRYKVKFVKFDPDASNVLARVTVTDDQISERYEANKEKGFYDIPPATTNDVKTYRPLEDVRGSIEIALRHDAAVELLKSDVREIVSSMDEEDEQKAATLLSDVAAREGLSVGESEWFALVPGMVPGFMKTPESQFPGVDRKVFDRTVRSLVDYRFSVLASKRSVWLVEFGAKSPAHVPEFEEAKDKIVDRAVADARLDAFKADVEAVAAKGRDAVLQSGNVSTNIVFSPCTFARDYAMGWFNRFGEWDFSNAGFPDADKVVFAVHSLDKGAVSDFVSAGPGKALLVVCEDRRDGDPADLMRGERFARMISMRRMVSPDDWFEWNLKRMGYEEKTSPDDDAAGQD